jgi:hypothetical protein
VINCQHCGQEVEEGRNVCPHCGRPVSVAAEAAATQSSPEAGAALQAVAGGRGAGAAGATAPMTEPVAVRPFGQPDREEDKSRRVIFIAVGVVAALLLGGLAWLASRPSAKPGEERLADAIRPGAAEFPAADKLVVDFDPNADASIGPTALGPWAVTMKPTVRNFTGRTVSGLEFRAWGIDLSGNVIRQRTFVTEQQIEPNKVHVPSIGLNFPQDGKPADLKLELTGVRFR